MNDWKETRLWASLKDSDAAITLQECMPQIQTVLHSASTMPIDFTLHDADHSFRVAERAAELLPSKILERLGKYDASLLLLAAYLHDIGMSPSRDLYKRHHHFIVSGNTSQLSDVEQNEFQQWLDENWQGLVPPISADETSEHGISMTDEILAYYCRHKHNDWSEKWIRENLMDLRSSLYHGWVDDLITLCRSHHEGLASLKADRFDIRVVGASGEVINLRYLAALLRLADVLEFDPERTPSVIMRHRDIAPKSKIYWRKDHTINFSVDAAEKALFLSARTPDAGVHRAVLDTIDAVNLELNTCATLNHEGLFQKGTVPQSAKDRYQWPWPSQLRVDIKEKDNSFVYIDGGFRPDKVKILELLSGTQLYGNHWAAVRELLQNATDAVREQIARERLRKDEPGNSNWQTILGQTHKIRITLETDGTSFFLSCSDDGVGMDRNVIENHLLVSGSRSRGDLIALDRDSKRHGFSVGSTGQFGIGLLSYFMLADDISISTRRSAEAGDVDGTGWRFSIEGLDSFGELRAESRGTSGTIVRLRLKSDVLGDSPQEFSNNLLQYIRSTFRYSPCLVTFLDQISGQNVIFPQGWTESEEDWAARCLIERPPNHFGVHRQGDFVPFNEREKSLDFEAKWSSIVEDFLQKRSLFGPIEEKIDEVEGQIRAWVGFQRLEGGASLAYLNIVDGIVKDLMSNQDFLCLPGAINIAWRGFNTDMDYGRMGSGVENNVLADLNCAINGIISVNRKHVKYIFNIYGFLNDFRTSIITRFLDSNHSSDFSLLNCHIANGIGVPYPAVKCKWRAIWPMHEQDGKKLKSIEFPCADILLPRYSEFMQNKYNGIIRGEGKYKILAHLRGDRNKVAKVSDIIYSGKLAFLEEHIDYIPVVTWESEADFRGVDARPFACAFPDDWKSVALVMTSERPIFNINHDLVASEFSLQLNLRGHTVEHIVDLVRKKQKRSAYREIILLNLHHGQRFWNGLKDNFPDEFATLIREAGLPDGCIRAWHYMGRLADNRTLLLNENGAKEFIQNEDGFNRLNHLQFSDGVNFKFKDRELILK